MIAAGLVCASVVAPPPQTAYGICQSVSTVIVAPANQGSLAPWGLGGSPPQPGTPITLVDVFPPDAGTASIARGGLIHYSFGEVPRRPMVVTYQRTDPEGKPHKRVVVVLPPGTRLEESVQRISGGGRCYSFIFSVK